MEYIRRSMEPYIQKAEKNFKSVLVTGARQTGKSTLLKAMFPDRSYVTFDDPFLEEQARKSPDMFLALHQPPVIFDKVQRVPGLFRYMKMKCDESQDKGLFALSGSQPFQLMKTVSESMSGRVCIIELAPLSLREIQKDSFDRPFLPTMDYILERKKTVRKPDNIWEVIHRGGYPELYQNPGLDWQAFYASYVKTYLERDVRELSAVQDLDAFRRCMTAVAARTGQMVNYANIAEEVSKDAGTIRKWMSILEASGIIYLLEPYTPAVLKRAIRTPKVYFRDTGLASYLTRWLTPETLALGAMSGQEIRMEGEIDFIIEENGILYPIEIKKNTSETASAASAFPVLDQVENKTRGMGAVISMCPEPGMLRDNILEIPVWYV